jgi:hypothetical protein
MKDISKLMSYCDDKCSPISEEILNLFLKTFDKDYLSHIENISPNCRTNLPVPEDTYGYKPDKVREYKVVSIRFFGLPFDCIDLGVVKNTSGKGTGYVVAVISEEDNWQSATKAYSVTGFMTLEEGFKKLSKFVNDWVHEHRGVKTGKSTGILDNDTSWKKVATVKRGVLDFSDFLKIQRSGE